MMERKSEDSALPPNWVQCTIGDITEPVEKIDPKDVPGREIIYIDISGIDNQTNRIATTKSFKLAEAPSRARQIVRSGDVLFSTVRPYLRNIAQVGPQLDGEISSTGFSVLRSAPGIEPSFLFLKSLSKQFVDTLSGQQYGVSYPAVKDAQVRAQSIYLPPTNEQRRIVEKIETLFAQLDKGEEALREVQKLLDRYRQSVLKAAVTGQLTADWRAENAHRLGNGRDLLARIQKTRRETWQSRGKYKEPAAPDTTDLPELPEGWVWASVAQMANVIGGLTKNKKRQEMLLRKPMLRVANVYQNRLDLEDIHQTGVTETEFNRVLLEDLDLLVVEGNGSKGQIGRMAIWRNEIPGAVHQNHLIKVRMIEKRLVEFALFWFQSPNGRQNIEKVASSTSGLYTLSISKIEALVVPIPSLLEIAEINQIVDDAFSKIAHLEDWCKTELARCSAARQAILKDAFAGRLVPQDLADEPAADLLARIREARAAAPAKTRRKIQRKARA